VTTAVIGATGHVGTEVVRGLLAGGNEVVALVRDVDEAHRRFGAPDGLRVEGSRLDDPADVAAALAGIATAFIAMGSVGIQGVVQRVVVTTAARVSSIAQLTRLAVLNASADSLGINQRAHFSIDRLAAATGVPYSTIRPAIFSSSLLAAAPQVRATRTWTGIADSGRTALVDFRDAAEVAVLVLTDRALWGAHHDLTGPEPMSWPEALELLSAELGETVTFRAAPERQVLQNLVAAGVPPGEAELLIAREWAILAGENDYVTDTVQRILGRPPRTVADFLHEHRDASCDLTLASPGEGRLRPPADGSAGHRQSPGTGGPRSTVPCRA
jgi:NAD(P)H dehydrogenase (quinone)